MIVRAIEAWSEVEPDRCKRRFDIETEKYPLVVDVAVDGATMTLSPTLRKWERGYLLHAVLEAVEARGWSWEISASQDEDGDWSYDGTVWVDEEQYTRGASLDREVAMITAYLDAVRGKV